MATISSTLTASKIIAKTTTRIINTKCRITINLSKQNQQQKLNKISENLINAD